MKIWENCSGKENPNYDFCILLLLTVQSNCVLPSLLSYQKLFSLINYLLELFQNTEKVRMQQYTNGISNGKP